MKDEDGAKAFTNNLRTYFFFKYSKYHVHFIYSFIVWCAEINIFSCLFNNLLTKTIPGLSSWPLFRHETIFLSSSSTEWGFPAIPILQDFSCVSHDALRDFLFLFVWFFSLISLDDILSKFGLFFATLALGRGFFPDTICPQEAGEKLTFFAGDLTLTFGSPALE